MTLYAYAIKFGYRVHHGEALVVAQTQEEAEKLLLKEVESQPLNGTVVDMWIDQVEKFDAILAASPSPSPDPAR